LLRWPLAMESRDCLVVDDQGVHRKAPRPFPESMGIANLYLASGIHFKLSQ